MCAKLLQLCPTLCDPVDYGILRPWNSPGQNTGVGSLSLLQGILPTQGSNLSVLPWQVDSLPLSHQGSLLSHMLLLLSRFSRVPLCVTP